MSTAELQQWALMSWIKGSRLILPFKVRHLGSCYTDANLKTTQQLALWMRRIRRTPSARKLQLHWSRRPRCASQPPLLSSLLPVLYPFLILLMLCTPRAPSRTHRSAPDSFFPASASVPRDLYVYGHYWRWVIHFCFSLLLHLPLLSFGRACGCCKEYQWPPPFLFDHSFLLPLTTPLFKSWGFFFVFLLIWSVSKTLLMSKGILAFPSRIFLFYQQYIFQLKRLLGPLIWRVCARFKKCFCTSADLPHAARRAGELNCEAPSQHGELRVSVSTKNR